MLGAWPTPRAARFGCSWVMARWTSPNPWALLAWLLAKNWITSFLWLTVTCSGLMGRCGAMAKSFKSSKGCSAVARSEEHTSELQSRGHLVCRLLLEKKKHIGKQRVQ